MLQKVQYDAAGKLSVKSSSTVYFPNIKSHYPVLKEKTRNKVITLDTHKKNQMQGNQDKELPHVSR